MVLATGLSAYGSMPVVRRASIRAYSTSAFNPPRLPCAGATTTQVNRKGEQKMDQIFPQTIFVALAGSGDDAYLSISKTEIEAIMSTDDENQAMVAEYLLVSLRHRAISKTVVNAK